jgi:hypothetical protein
MFSLIKCFILKPLFVLFREDINHIFFYALLKVKQTKLRLIKFYANKMHCSSLFIHCLLNLQRKNNP